MSIYLYLVLLPALGPLVYYCLAIYSGWIYFRKIERFSPPKSNKIAAVSILKPVRGVDHEAYENFASMCQLDYPEYEIIFGVGEADDPVIPLLQKLQAKFLETSIRVIVGIKQLGSCHKTNTLYRLALEAKHSLLVINDSDVRMEKDYLRQILASFSDPKVRLFTALFQSRAGNGFAERLDANGVGCRPTQRPACFYSGDSRKSISPMAGQYIFSKRRGECPQCGSHLVKRCRRKGFVEVVVFRVLYLWPFLCNECNARYFDYIRSIEQSKQPLS